jgi:creatinine amidohydrolase/Fe(II)-dependent formamide hydrolase-like protein
MKRTVALSAAMILAAGFAFAQQGQKPDPRSMGGGDCAKNTYNCRDTANPLPKVDTVWLEEMTWMDVRDAMNAGKKTIIISTGGIEPNGPWLALGKHNYVMRANCDAIARKLGNALCAPIVPFVPEGNLDTKTGHMGTPGTISMRPASYEAMLTDIADSFRVGGFENIVMIGDSGGNQNGMKAVAAKLNADGKSKAFVVHIPEYYDYESVEEFLRQKGVMKPKGSPIDELHDDPTITMNMMVTDPESVRWSARTKAGKATIDGVSIADKDKAVQIGKEIVEFRANATAELIKKAIAAKGK